MFDLELGLDIMERKVVGLLSCQRQELIIKSSVQF